MTQQGGISIHDLSSINGSTVQITRPPVVPQETPRVSYDRRSSTKKLPTPSATPGDAAPSTNKQHPAQSPISSTPMTMNGRSGPTTSPTTDWLQLNRAVKHHNYSQTVHHLAISSAVLNDDNWIWLCRVLPLLNGLSILDLSNTGMTDERCRMLIGDLSVGDRGSGTGAPQARRGHAGAGSPLYGLLRNSTMRLRTIDWSCNEIGHKAAASIGKLIRHFWHSLVFLNLRRNRVNDHGVQLLGSHISSLYEIAERVEQMTSLRAIDLSSNKLTARGVAELVVQATASQSISNLVLCDNIRTRPVTLSAAGSPLSSPFQMGRSPSAGTNTSESSQLTSGLGSVVPYIPRDLLHAMVCPNGLRSLNLDNCHLGAENGIELLRVILYSCTTLAELHLANNDLDDAIGLEFVDTLRDLDFLSVLDLSNNPGLTTETVKLLCHAISALGKMPHLQHLNLSRCISLTFEDAVNLVQLGVPEVREGPNGGFEAAASDGHTNGLVVLPCALPALNTLDITYAHLNMDECNVLHQVLRDNAGCTVRFGPPCDGSSKKIVTQHSPPSRTGVIRRDVPHQVSPTPFELAEDEQPDPSLDTALDPPEPPQGKGDEMLFEDDRSLEVLEELVVETSCFEEERRRDLDDEEASEPPAHNVAVTSVVPPASSLSCSPIKDKEEDPDVTKDEEGLHATAEGPPDQGLQLEDTSEAEASVQPAITVQEPSQVVNSLNIETDTKEEVQGGDPPHDPTPTEEIVAEKIEEPKLSARERLKARREARSTSRKRKFSYMWDHSENHCVCRILHLNNGERAVEMQEAIEADLDAILHDGCYEDGQVGNLLSDGKKRTELDLSTIQLPTVITHSSETLSTLRERIRSAPNEKFANVQKLRQSDGGDSLYQLLFDRFTALNDQVGLESIDRLLHDSHGREDVVVSQLPPAPVPATPAEEDAVEDTSGTQSPSSSSTSSLSVTAEDSADKPPPDAANKPLNASHDSNSSGNNVTTLLPTDKIIIESNDTEWHLPDSDPTNPGPAYAPNIARCFPPSRTLDHGDVKIGQLIPVPPEAPEAAVASQNALNRSEMGSLSRSHSTINRLQGESIPNGSAAGATGDSDPPGWAQNLDAQDAAAAAFNPSEEQKLQSYQSMLHTISQPSSGHATPLAESIHSQDNQPLNLRSPSMMLERFVEKPKPVSTKPQLPPEKLVPFAETMEERKRAIKAPSLSNPSTPIMSRQSSIESVDKRRRIHAAQKRQNELKEAFAYAKACLRNQQIDLPQQHRNKVRICQGKMGRIDLTVSVEWSKWLVIKNKIGMGAKDVLAMHPLLAVDQTASKPFVSEAPGNNLLITLTKPRHLVDEEIAKEQDPSKSRRRTAFSQSETQVFQITLEKSSDVTRAKEVLLRAVEQATGPSPSVSPRQASYSGPSPVQQPSSMTTPDRSASVGSRDQNRSVEPAVSRSESAQSSVMHRQASASSVGGDPRTPQRRAESEVVGFTNPAGMTPVGTTNDLTANAYGQNAAAYGHSSQPGYGYA